MSDEEKLEKDTESLFNASQYLIITMMGELSNVREHLGDEDGFLTKESIKSLKDNLDLLDKIADEFIDLDQSLTLEDEEDGEDEDTAVDKAEKIVDEAIDIEKELPNQ